MKKFNRLALIALTCLFSTFANAEIAQTSAPAANIGIDPAIYIAKGTSGEYTFTNKWLFSKNLNNYSTTNDLLGATATVRGMAAKSGKMLFPDRGNKRIIIIDGLTGAKETPVNLAADVFTYTGRNKANTADSIWTAGTLINNDIKVDNGGNVLVSNLITTNSDRFQIWKIDMTTGNGTLVIDQANLASLFPSATTLRFDAFGVVGDVTNNAVIFAINANAMEVYKWKIVNGTIQSPIQITLDNTSGADLIGLLNIGTAPQVFPLSENLMYVDGNATNPILIDGTGKFVDGFSNTSLPNSLNAEKGHNGVYEFSLGGESFLVAAGTNTVGNPPSAFKLYRFTNSNKSFSSLELLWSFPQDGMGNASNAYRSAIPVVETNGQIAKIYVYTGENGYGVYEFKSTKAVATPTITTNTSSKTGFNYQDGNGPSASQSFTFSASNLTANVTITAPTGFEMSTDNSLWVNSKEIIQTNGLINSTKVYIRLASGGTINSYSGNLTLSSTSATTKIIALSGSISTSSGTPIINTNLSSLSGLSENTFKEIIITGENLTDNITLQLNNGYVLKHPADGQMLLKSFIFSKTGGSVYVGVETYSEPGTLTITSPGAETKIVNLSCSANPPTSTFRIIPNISGNLEMLLGPDILTVTDLTVTGSMDARDFKIIRDNMPALVNLDIRDVDIMPWNGAGGTSTSPTMTYGPNQIPTRAFFNGVMIPSTKLKSIILPPTLTNIGTQAFYYCQGLTSVNIPAGVTSVTNAFNYCSATFTVDPANPMYSSLDGVLYNKSQIQLLQCPTSKSGEFNIPSIVISFGSKAFAGCVNLTSVNIPANVPNVGSGFLSCSPPITVDAANTSYSAVDGVLFDKAISRLIACPTSKTGVYAAPSTVTKFDSNAFSNCNLLTSVKIPALVTAFGYGVFTDCAGLTEIRVNNPTPIPLTGNPFTGVNVSSCKLIVPNGSITAYQAAIFWNLFANIIVESISITTSAATSIASTASTLNGSITSIGDLPVTAYGFCWNTTGNPTTADSKIDKGSVSTIGAFTHNLTGLNTFTTYYVKTFITNRDGTVYGSEVNFTTDIVAAFELTTNTTTSVLATTATLNGHINILTPSTISTYGFCWNKTGSPTITDTKADLGTNPGSVDFTNNLTGLIFATKYYVRSFTTNELGTKYGNEVNFTTQNFYALSTTDATDVLAKSATLNGNITVIESNPTATYGFCWNTTGNPTLTDNKSELGTNPSSGTITSTVSTFNSLTKYYVRAYFTSSNGTTSYGSEVNFTTRNFYTLLTTAATNILAKSATLNGNITVIESNPTATYGFCWNTTGTPTVTDSKSELGTNPSSGTITGSVSTLQGNITYYVRSYATNENGTSYGNEVNFTTALPDTYSVTVQINGSGEVQENSIAIANNAVLTVNRGTSKTFTFVSAGGYQVTGLTYNGTNVYSQLNNNEYTTPLVSANSIFVVTFGNNIRTINVTTAGTLSSLLSSVDKSAITNLTVTGNIDARDVKCMRDEMSILANLNLKDANILAYNGTGGTYTGANPWDYIANELPLNSFCTTYGYDGKLTLRDVILPSSLVSIGNNAFASCKNITKIILPINTASLGYQSLFLCLGLKTIISLNTSPPILGENCLIGDTIRNVYVPVGSTAAYKAATGWSGFNIEEYLLKASTQAVSSIKLTTAKLNGTVDVITDSPVTAHGFCWNTTGSPTIADTKVDNGAKTTEGTFSNEITGLSGATTYYVRAYATDGTGTVYGDEVTFATAEIPATSSLGGNYYNSQYWPLSKSPYTISANVNLAEGTTLTIEPGVVVNFAGNYEIMIMGNIIANGTAAANDSITFNAYSAGCTFLDFKNSKLSDSQLAYLKLIGKGTTYIKTQGSCTDSLIISNSRIETISANAINSIYYVNSKINLLSGGSSKSVVKDSRISNSSFGTSYNYVSIKLDNSTGKNLSVNGGVWDGSTIELKNSVVSGSTFGMYNPYLKISNSVVNACNFNWNSGGNSANVVILKSRLSNCVLSPISGSPVVSLDSTFVINTNIFSNNSYGFYSGINAIIHYCIFKTDSTQTLNLNGTISKSQFIGNNNKVGGIGLDAITGTITNSTIVNHRIGLQTSSLTINNSNLINNSQYAIKNTGATQIDAKSNFWGIGNTTIATVKSKIWDYYRDMNLGKVLYDNYLATPNTDAPITPPQNFRKMATQAGGVTYTWNPNPESDTKGYKLYYGKSDGFTFANSVDLGNVTTYTLPTALIADTVLVTAYDLLANGKDDMLKGHESWYSDNVILPSKAGVISGTTVVCKKTYSLTYTVPVIPYATTYVWSLPTGATGTSSTNGISVTFSSALEAGNISVFGRNEYGDGTPATLAITVNPLPDAAGTITGISTVCQGTSAVIYSVPAITNATSYTWTLPTGVTGTSTTNSITVNVGATAVSGNIIVKGTNGCGDGVASTLAVTVNPLPVVAGAITGSSTVCQGLSAVTYSVPTIVNATSCLWTLPTGATGTSTTNTIVVSFSKTAVSGNVTVKGHNDCGDGVAKILAVTVNPLPVAAGIISGSATVCQGQTSVTYSVPSITNATSYTWTLATGATGSSTTNSITVNYSKTAISGNVTVKGTNGCGDGDVSTLVITVNPLPDAAGTITGISTVCQGTSAVIYSVPAITNATSYTWTLPAGVTGTSTTNSITVNVGTTAVSGNIAVKGTNGCGDGVASTFAVTVNPLPVVAGAITGSSTVCQGQNAVTYSVPTIVNATSYLWTLPTGATGTSTTNTIVVSFSKTAVSGSVTVKGHNDCGDGVAKILAVTVNSLPTSAGAIAGPTIVCQGETVITYSVPAITNATSYTWTLPSGVTGTSTTNSISVSFGTAAVSGNITVKGTNDCGDGLVSTQAIVINQKPETPVIVRNVNLLTSSSISGNQWYNSKGLIIGETNPEYSVSSNDSYYVIVTKNSCGSESSNTIRVDNTALNSVDMNNAITIYPNPATTSIKITSAEIIERLQVSDISGRIIRSVIVNNNVFTLSVDNFSKGVYFINAYTNGRLSVQKFIKE